ncbi:hypothetical protein FRC03_010629 [Tulasnella sp. 419]|nr:hypothetical protein FRC03_010629 [Tulasnella sp. 419]
MDPNTYFLLDRVEVQFDDDVPANTATSEAPVDSSTVSQTPALPSSTSTSPITTTTTSSPARLPGDGISSRDTSTLRSTSSTTSSPAPSSSLSGSQSQRPESINIPAIAGGVGGGTVVVCLVILGIIILCRRKRRSRFPLRGDAILLQRSKLHRIPSSIPDEKYLELAPKVSRERVHRDFKFLQMESLCDLSQLGISREWVSTVSNDTIILTNPNFSKSDTHAGSQAIIFDIPSRTKQRILQSSQDADSFVFAHSLSPDKKLLVRWIKKRSSSTDCVIEVADFPVNHLYRRLTSQLHCDIWDARASKWINDNTIVIPDSRSRTITRWSITADRLEPTIIRPLAEITRHKSLAFYTTAGEKWLVTNGWTAGLYGATGVIEARRYDGSRSRMITGVACCTTEVAFYDERRTLLVVADLEADKLILKVEQLEQSPESGPFQPVRTSVDLHVSGDCPQMVMVLQHLPIVVVSTIKGSLYFFELYFGSYLYSQSLSSEEVWCGSADDQSILVHSPNKGSIERVSVNTNDLIGFVRNVLKNDVLASSIAMRAGLPGAEDVAWADMHGEYRNFSEIDMV